MQCVTVAVSQQRGADNTCANYNFSDHVTQGMTAVRMRATRASLICDGAVQLVEVFTGCACSRRLVFSYPSGLQPEDFLSAAHNFPRDPLGQPLFFDLEVRSAVCGAA